MRKVAEKLLGLRALDYVLAAWIPGGCRVRREFEGWLLVLALALLSAGAVADDAPSPTGLAATPGEKTPSVDSPPPAVRRVVLRGVKFGSDTAFIEPESAGVLELVAQTLRETPDVRVRITGYTDEQASEAHNLELSLARAESVKRILVGFGVASARIEAVGRGEADPIASNDTTEGRAINRRVELKTIE